jgi:dipeptidyl aminopeptidase/acylaminoacyl peptidase
MPSRLQVSDRLATDAYRYSPFVFGALPWDRPQAFWDHSPLSLAGKIRTPLMLIVGDKDYCTPMTESLQMYNALRLLNSHVQLVVVPDASHESLRARPSQYVAQFELRMRWYARWGGLAYRLDSAGVEREAVP